MTRRAALAVLLCLAALTAAAAERVQARLARVIDGDTLVVRVDSQQVRLQLRRIDAPERGQDHFRESTNMLHGLLSGRDLDCQIGEADRYQRLLSSIRVDGLDVELELLRLGGAWVYPDYRQDEALMAIETEAREAARGLWADPSPIAPWDWRQGAR